MSKSKVRIIERTGKLGDKRYILQYRQLFWWFDAKFFSPTGLKFSFDTIDEAKAYIPLIDGTEIKERVVYEVAK